MIISVQALGHGKGDDLSAKLLAEIRRWPSTGLRSASHPGLNCFSHPPHHQVKSLAVPASFADHAKTECMGAIIKRCSNPIEPYRNPVGNQALQSIPALKDGLVDPNRPG